MTLALIERAVDELMYLRLEALARKTRRSMRAYRLEASWPAAAEFAPSNWRRIDFRQRLADAFLDRLVALDAEAAQRPLEPVSDAVAPAEDGAYAVDLRSLRLRTRLTGRVYPIRSVAFSPSQNRAAFAYASFSTRLRRFRCARLLITRSRRVACARAPGDAGRLRPRPCD